MSPDVAEGETLTAAPVQPRASKPTWPELDLFMKHRQACIAGNSLSGLTTQSNYKQNPK